MPKVSIIIPVYKVEKYLPACLDSVLDQTFLDWEAICVDDGSPDNCGKILSEYSQKDRRIKVITQKNQGVSAARNNALKQAVGKYICFLDSDDELAPTFMEKMYNALVKNNADVSSCTHQTGPQKKKWNNQHSLPQIHTNVFHKFLKGNSNIPSCINKMYKKSVLQGIFFPEEIAIGEDLVFLYKALYQTQKAVYIPEELYFYRIRENSAMNSNFSSKTILENIKVAELLLSYFKDKNMPINTRKALNQKMAKRILKFAIIEPKRKDKKNLFKWYAITHPLLFQLMEKRIYRPRYLSIKNQIKSWMFLKKTPSG